MASQALSKNEYDGEKESQTGFTTTTAVEKFNVDSSEFNSHAIQSTDYVFENNTWSKNCDLKQG